MQQHVFAIAKTLATLGVKHVIICPGSRSAPLVYAFADDKNFCCYSVIDERSAAFIALGMAQQIKQPVVLICTSGSALLNFFPAIAEAYYQKIPLIVLTADRPPEFLNQQDGQMIMQKNIYGTHVHYSDELPCYTIGKENFKKTSEIIFTAFQISKRKLGPVHINVPLREPLYDRIKLTAEKKDTLPASIKLNAPFTETKIKRQQNKALIDAWKRSKKKIILIGQFPVNDKLFTALRAFKNIGDTVILCDILSNKQSVCTIPNFDLVLSQANEKTLKQLEPDMLISIGGPVLSKSLKLWLKNQKPNYHFRIQDDNDLIDTYNNVTQFIRDDHFETLKVLGSFSDINSDYKKFWQALDKRTNEAVDSFLEQYSPKKRNQKFSELHATNIILKNIPDAVNFHIANSSCIRYVSLLGKLNDSWVMSGNRGTSGIDGCTSTALGAALINNRLTLLLTGDLAFLYDRNALWNKHVPNNLRIIVFNNFGGGIFQLIDGPSSHKNKLNYFTTPHQTRIKNTVLDNDMEYYFCDSEEGLKKVLPAFFDPDKRASVLEITFDMDQNAGIFKAFKKIKI